MAPLNLSSKLKRVCLIAALVLTVIPIVIVLINHRLASHPLIEFLGLGLALCVVSFVLYFKDLLRGLTGQKLRQALGLAVYMTIILGVCILVYLLGARYHGQWDLTKAKLNSLSQETRDTLARLPEPLNIVCFFQADDQVRPAVAAMLDQYTLFSKGKLKYEIIDPDRNPAKAESYKLEKYGTVFVESSARREKVDQLSENDLTNGILKVLQNQQKTVAFLRGHGETLFTDESPQGLSLLKAALVEDNLTIKEIELFKETAIPINVQCVVVDHPKTELFPNEVKILNDYLTQGGSVLVLTGSEVPASVKTFITAQGVVLGEDRVVDKLSRLVGQEPTSPLITKYGEHPITARFQLASVMPITCSVQVKDNLGEDTEGEVLAYSTPQSWAETNLVQLEKGQANLDPNDIKGPVSLAVVIEKHLKGDSEKPKSAKLAVFGSSRFVENNFLAFSGNKDLFLNTIQWLCGESELITIRPKKVEQSTLILNATQQRLMFFVPVIFMPLVAILAGVVVRVRRRMSR